MLNTCKHSVNADVLEKFQIVHSETTKVCLKDNDSDMSYIFQRRHIKDLKTNKQTKKTPENSMLKLVSYLRLHESYKKKERKKKQEEN